MNIKESKITKIEITDIDRLDPVTVFIEDHSIGKGELTIKCYGQSWTAYWGATGNRSLIEFVLSCDIGYLGNKMRNGIPMEVTDHKKLRDILLTNIIKARMDTHPNFLQLDADEAREKYDLVMSIDDEDLTNHPDILSELIDNEWWHTLPTKTNPDYDYLCRILTAVQEALRQYTTCKEN